MFRCAHSSRLLKTLLLLVLVTSLLWRGGLCAMQIEHVLGEMTEANAASEHAMGHGLDLVYAHHHDAHEASDESLVHTVHGFLHVLDTMDTHPPLHAEGDIHSTVASPAHDQWSHHAPEPPIYLLFRPPRAFRSTLS